MHVYREGRRYTYGGCLDGLVPNPLGVRRERSYGGAKAPNVDLVGCVGQAVPDVDLEGQPAIHEEDMRDDKATVGNTGIRPVAKAVHPDGSSGDGAKGLWNRSASASALIAV